MDCDHLLAASNGAFAANFIFECQNLLCNALYYANNYSACFLSPRGEALRHPELQRSQALRLCRLGSCAYFSDIGPVFIAVGLFD